MAALPSGTVTFLFTDVEGSTRLLAELGPERYADVLAEHRRVLRAAFADHGGIELGTEGDSFFVVFERAGDALAAAVRARDGVADAVRVRIGMHTGEPLLTEEGYVGMDVHRAARIAAVAHGGQILVSQSTHELVPGVALRDLGEHRLRDLVRAERIWQLGAGEFPPLKSLHRTNLPVAASPLIGRRVELARIEAELRDGARLLTITGAGGSGKTRLALQAAADLADEFAGGTYFVELAPLSDATAVPGAVARALEVQSDDRIGQRLSEARALLVLDNAEHLAGIEHEVARLRVGDTVLLVTSRSPLHLSGEHELPLQPLPEDEAVELFATRATERGRPIERVDVAREICRRLDNLPLALELAAARLSVLSSQALLERLDRALPILTGGAHDLPERQRTLRATIDWSCRLLDERRRRALQELAVFRGGFAADAAVSVAAAGLDDLAELVDQSLVRSVGDGRFLMLETVREFALDELDARGDRAAAERRHADYYLERIRTSDEVIRGPQTSEFLAWYENEAENTWLALDTLVAAGRHEQAWQLADLLSFYWIACGRLRESVRWLRRALQASDERTAGRGLALSRLGEMLERLGAIREARDAVSEAERLALETGDERAQFGVYRQLRAIELTLDDAQAAMVHARRALEVAPRVDERAVLIARCELADTIIEGRGDLDEAELLLTPVLERFVAAEDSANEAGVHVFLATIAFCRRLPAVADVHLERALTAVRRVGSAPHECIVLAAIGFQALAFDRPDEAERALAEALEIAVDADLEREALVLVELIAILRAQDARVAAGDLYATVAARRAEQGLQRRRVELEVFEHVLGADELDGDVLPWGDAVALARTLVERS